MGVSFLMWNLVKVSKLQGFFPLLIGNCILTPIHLEKMLSIWNRLGIFYHICINKCPGSWTGIFSLKIGTNQHFLSLRKVLFIYTSYTREMHRWERERERERGGGLMLIFGLFDNSKYFRINEILELCPYGTVVIVH